MAAAGNNRISIAASGTMATVSGLPAQVTIDHAEGANDSLFVNGLGGNDSIDASALDAGQINLTIDGGAGNDTIIGSAGDDLLAGGDGNDVVTGGRGNDVALLGTGDDRFIWNPGDGSDIVEGQAGTDTLVFNGSECQREYRPLGQWQPGRDCSATSAMSRWISTASSVSRSRPPAVPTTS